MTSISLAFKRPVPEQPGAFQVGICTGRTYRSLHSAMVEIGGDPDEFVYADAAIFFSTQMTLQGDDYVATNTTSNLYELLSEPHQWKKVAWGSILMDSRTPLNAFDNTGPGELEATDFADLPEDPPEGSLPD
jgi:hypothetical protein